jgi:hypothetical protein
MTFDIALGMDEATLNRVIATLYQRPNLKSKLFSGREQTTILNVPVQVDWEVQAAPAVSLTAPDAQKWHTAILADGKAAQPSSNAFVVHLPMLKVGRTSSGSGRQETALPLDAICTAAIAGDRLSYNALAVCVDLSAASQTDQALYRAFIIPRILRMVATMLGQQHVPSLDFHGLKFGEAALYVGNGRIVGTANLAGKPPATPADGSTLPGVPFFVLLSAEAMQRAGSMGAAGLRGKSAGTSGDSSFGIGKASYNASVTLTDISVSPSGDPTVVHASVGISAQASAGVDVLSGILNTVAGGATTAANTVAGGVTTAANTVAGGVTTAANTVASGVTTAANAVADAFHSY